MEIRQKKIKNICLIRFIEIINNNFRIYPRLKRTWLKIISKWLLEKKKKKKLRFPGRNKEQSRRIFIDINKTFTNYRSWLRFWLCSNRTKKYWQYLFHELNSLMFICNRSVDLIFFNKKWLFEGRLVIQVSTESRIFCPNCKIKKKWRK